MADALLEFVAGLSGWLLHLVAFLLAFAEAGFLLDLVIPGEVGLVVVAAAGRRDDGILGLLIVLGALGAVAGDSFSWYLGHRWGESVVERWSWTRRVLGPKLDSAHDLFTRHGGAAIFVARWVGALRAVTPLVAGAAQMPYRRLLLWDAPAALAWSTVAVSLGWFLGEHIADAVDAAGTVISAIVVVGLLGWWAWRRRRRHHDQLTG